MRNEKGVSLRQLGIIVLGTLLLGLILACSLFNQAPVARIVATAVSGSSPLVVTFNASNSTDADGMITAYVWSFGDGTSDTGVTTQHVFSTIDAVKVFTVTLIVTDDDGTTAQATQTIEVTSDGNPSTGTGVPTARFTVNRFIGVSPLSVTFDATGSTPGSGTIAAYNWNFGDGDTATGANPTHVFAPEPEQTTIYPATLFVWNSNNQVDTMQWDIIVIVPENENQGDAPIADIFVSDPDLIFESESKPAIPSLFEVKFDPRGSSADAGHSLEYYAWDFGDGDIRLETSDLEVTHIYELASPSRTYVVRLTVFDDSGMEHTDIVNITLTEEED